MTLRTVKLVIAFQGTHYSGWQSQKSGKTVQEILEAQLKRLFKVKINLHGSSRTDAGVHAKGFVAHFRATGKLPDAKIQDALNFYLPKDIVVLAAKTVNKDFHARFSAKSKTYEYRLWNDRVRPAYDRAPFVMWTTHKLDMAKMRQAARHLIGKQDFNAFRDSGEEERKTVKRLKSCVLIKRGPLVIIRLTADGFLKHMIRVLAGTLLEVGRGRLKPDDIPPIIRSKSRKNAGPTLRAHGLTLLKVHY